MNKQQSKSFSAKIDIIGINPFVHVPEKILNWLFKQANKHKGPIPIKGFINDSPYKQTLVKYGGEWRLYINTTMLKDSPKRLGETIKLTIEFDPDDRTIPMHPGLKKALLNNKEANARFNGLPPSRRHEIVRYISSLKTTASIEKNIERAINFLTGKGKFVGRDKL